MRNYEKNFCLKTRAMTMIVALPALAFSLILLSSLAARSAETPSETPAAKAADAQNGLEEKIWNLLDNDKAVYVTLPEADFRALGKGFDLPDGGKTVTELAMKAPGGAFDPRDVAKIPAATLGYKADWIVERYKRYNLDWDITGLRLTSLDPDAKKYPWMIIMNGGAANVYEFFVDLKNRPGWGQYLAQKLNVMIITIPGNFKYGGWDEPIQSIKRQPQYLLDRDLSMEESEVRNCLLTNAVVLQGVKALIMKHTQGDILMVGHSTSGEISMLANDDPDLRARLKGRYMGWGSGGPARMDNVRMTKEGKGGAGFDAGATAAPARKHVPLQILSRRDVASYSHGYSGFLNPLYEPGMSHAQIAEKWLEVEGRRRANFKQQIQDLEHGGDIDQKGRVEVEIENLLKKSGNPWGVNLEDVSKDLFMTHYTRMDGYKTMVWTVGHFDRNHWLPEDPMKAVEVFYATEYRAKNPNAKIRLIVWDPPLTHYGHVEMPKQLAAADYSVIRWIMKQ